MDEFEAGLREALTDEAWAEVETGIVPAEFHPVRYPAVLDPDRRSTAPEDLVCSTCGALVIDFETETHAAWHRRLSIALRAQGVVVAGILGGIAEITDRDALGS